MKEAVGPALGGTQKAPAVTAPAPHLYGDDDAFERRPLHRKRGWPPRGHGRLEKDIIAHAHLLDRCAIDERAGVEEMVVPIFGPNESVVRRSPHGQHTSTHLYPYLSTS